MLYFPILCVNEIILHRLNNLIVLSCKAYRLTILLCCYTTHLSDPEIIEIIEIIIVSKI